MRKNLKRIRHPAYDAVEVVDEDEDDDGAVEAGQEDDEGAEDVAEASFETKEAEETEGTKDDDVEGGNVQLGEDNATRGKESEN